MKKCVSCEAKIRYKCCFCNCEMKKADVFFHCDLCDILWTHDDILVRDLVNNEHHFDHKKYPSVEILNELREGFSQELCDFGHDMIGAPTTEKSCSA